MKISHLHIVLILLITPFLYSQEDGVVALDLPVRNSLKFNKYAINPTFSFVREQNKYISFTNKRQWMQFENAPQTYLFSYSGRFRENSGIGIGLFQQNYGVLTTFGGVINYAQNAVLDRDSNLTFGLNLGFYKSGIKEGDVVTNFPDPSLDNITSNSIITITPGLNYGTAYLDFGVSINNLVLYNLTTSEIVNDNPQQNIQAHVMYTGYLNSGGFLDESKFSALVRSEFSKENTTVSGIAMLTIPKGMWTQVGYNSIYGASAGIGINITEQIAIEYNFEKSIGDLSGFGNSHEFTLAYKFNKNERLIYSRDDSEEGALIKPVTKIDRIVAKPKNTEVKPETNAKIAAEQAKAKSEQDARLKVVEDAKAMADAVAKAKADTDAKAKLTSEQAKAKADADAKANADAAAKAKLASDAKAKADAEAKAKLATEQAKVKAAEDARLKLAADAKAKADADAKAKLAADQAKAKAEEDARLKLAADAKAKADADAKAKLAADQAKAKAEEDARLKLAADAKAKADADAKAKLAADQAKAKAEEDARLKLAADAKAKADADAKAKLAADQAKAKAEEDARLKAVADAKAKAEEDARLKLAADAKAKAEADAKAKLAAEQAKPIANNTNEVFDKNEISKDSKLEHDKLLLKLIETVDVKKQDLKELKEENDLSEKGIITKPRAFKSITAENLALEALKAEIDNVIRDQNLRIAELERLYKEKAKNNSDSEDNIRMIYLDEIEIIKKQKSKTIRAKESLVSELAVINKATEIERNRRIRRALYDNEQDRYNKDQIALNVIKQNTPLSSTPLREGDFDSGEARTSSIQILKDVKNVEKGYYIAIAVHSDVAKRDEFITKAVAAGQKNINFFYDVNTSKYYIYYEKFDDIETAQRALQAQGSLPYNGKMSMVKIEN